VNDTLPYALTQIANWKNDNSFNEEAHAGATGALLKNIFRNKCAREMQSQSIDKKRMKCSFLILELQRVHKKWHRNFFVDS
jgi:hypothetical protein